MNKDMKRAVSLAIAIIVALALLALVDFSIDHPLKEKVTRTFKKRSSDPIYSAVLDQYSKTDVTSLIEIGNVRALHEKRSQLVQLVQLVFGEQRIPFNLRPQELINDIDDSDYTGLKSVERIDSLKLVMQSEIYSLMYYFMHRKTGNKLHGFMT